MVNAGVEGAAAYGFNAATEEYMDTIEAGIVDPTKVTRTALQNAASIAGLMITTERTTRPRKTRRWAACPAGWAVDQDQRGASLSATVA